MPDFFLSDATSINDAVAVGESLVRIQKLFDDLNLLASLSVSLLMMTHYFQDAFLRLTASYAAFISF